MLQFLIGAVTGAAVALVIMAVVRASGTDDDIDAHVGMRNSDNDTEKR